jgi:hypothetical protein
MSLIRRLKRKKRAERKETEPLDPIAPETLDERMTPMWRRLFPWDFPGQYRNWTWTKKGPK